MTFGGGAFDGGGFIVVPGGSFGGAALGGGEAVVGSDRARAPALSPDDGPEGGADLPESEGEAAPDRATNNGRGEGGEGVDESDVVGAYPLVAPHTGELKRLASAWMDARQRKQALKQRWSRKEGGERVWENAAAEKEHEAIVTIYDRWGREVKKALRRHPLWPFLSDLPGLAGPTTAYLIGKIRDPWRFPGQRCENGHYLRPIFEVGEPCPIEAPCEGEDDLERCGAPCLSPRRGTGVRALRWYVGIAPGAKKKKGQQATHDPQLKGLLLAPDTGLRAQIIRHKPEPYHNIYREQKERLIRERGYRSEGEVVEPVEARPEGDFHDGRPPPLIYLHKTAGRKALDAFVGDLLMAWKTVQDPEEY